MQRLNPYLQLLRPHQYIKNGFLAKTRSDEIRAKGYTVRITDSYRDVSSEVLGAVSGEMDMAQRAKAVERKIKEIVKQAEEEFPGKRAEVAEMFIGKTYVLFMYTFLKDVRLVYAPPRSIGEFGGEEDNWVWPRHTGDFSFIRAYVAPDGSSADYAPENVPYTPKKYLKVAPEGVNEEDFVFILGYPGRTFRHQTSHYMAFEEEIRMPYVVQWYQWQITVMDEMGKGDRAVALKHLSRIKGLSNTEKNYRGKLIGLKRMKLVDRKRGEEQALQQYIDADATRKSKYGTLLSDISAIYQERSESAGQEMVLGYLIRSSNLLNFAFTAYESAIERQKNDVERESAYMDRNFERTKLRLFLSLEDYYEPSDKVIFREMMMRAAQLPEGQKIPAIDTIVAGKDNIAAAVDAFIDDAYARSQMADENYLKAALNKNQDEIAADVDPFIHLAAGLYPTYQEMKRKNDARSGALDKLYAQLIDIKKEFLSADFVPDANGTLRLTYGRVRGYSPRDGVYFHPITTVAGVLEKTTGEEPFDTPDKLLQLAEQQDFGRFKNSQLQSVPVALLYNMDTTGGNSGSPVLNAKGELVGVNFDRAFEATINDYAWSEDYSRSIAVDIRYVLWVAQKFGQADHLLKEMGVK